jgi:cytochrome P450
VTRTPVAGDVTIEDLTEDPYPIYARLRREAPVCYVPAADLWFVTRWADVVEASEDPVRFPASMPASPLDRTLGGRSVLTVDGEEHQRMRAPMEKTLRPRAVEERARAIVERIANELIDEFAPRGEAELMSAFCEPLSALSLAEVIGLRGLDAPTLRRWFHELATGTSNYESDPEKQRVADLSSAEIDRTLRPLFAALLERPESTMVSDMLHAEVGDLDERMAAFMPTLKLALIGGLQEPGHGMGSTVFGLLSHPEQEAAIRGDPARQVKAAVDEGLRWISPIGTQGRAAGPGARVAGVEIPEGANVGLIVSSANRDEELWGPTADRFDLFRPRHAHAAFAFGPHFCVGHYLARLQVRGGVRLLFERLPALRLDPGRRARFSGWEYRGPAELPVRWMPERRHR